MNGVYRLPCGIESTPASLARVDSKAAARLAMPTQVFSASRAAAV